MIKRTLSFVMMMLCLISVSAQMPQPLPLNPAVKHGVLPNGLTYYILHNEEPKERANFYIAQKVGSTLENEKQLGLAHFLEHMAFNGTKNYPGKNMLNYLQANGIRFGADINAYTDFDETVYNINNVPTTNQNLMDSVLLVLRDWSCDILLEDEEIDAERKVIQEEWRGRNDVGYRMYVNALPVVYEESAYHQMPIGKMEVVMNFPYQDLRDYYETWYRPDQQGIVIVGDFDAAEMEQKVINMFSSVEMPENAPERFYVPVSDNVEPIFFSFEDPEMTNSMVMIDIKYDLIPKEYRNTDQAYMVEKVVQPVIASMVNTRLSEAAQKIDCPFAGAYVRFDHFLVSRNKGTFNITVIPKDNSLVATQAALEIVAQALKAGFTQSELKRVTDNMLSSYETRYNERDKTRTEALARGLIRSFIDHTAEPGIEMEYTLMQQLLPNIPVEVYNQLAAQILTPENQVIIVAQPKGEGFVLPGKEETVATISEALNKEYETYVDEVITEPLIAQLPAPGSVTAETDMPIFGATELTLSNGIKVYVKTTDFKADEVLFQAVKKGGLQTYPASDADNLLMLSAAFECVKFGPFDNIMLPKYLAGKKVGLGFMMQNTTCGLSGSSTVKDLQTLMELIYTAYTNLGEDKAAYEAIESQYLSVLAYQEKSPEFLFRKATTEAMMHGNPFAKEMSTEIVKNANYEQEFAIIRNALANPADFAFVFIGNVDVATLKPLLEQYIASLPTAPASDKVDVITPMNLTKGKYTDSFEVPMETPSTMIQEVFSGYNLEPTIESSRIARMLGSILDDRFTRIIREQEGAAYSPHAGGQYSFDDKCWLVYTSIQTNSEQQARVLELTKEILTDLLDNGATEEEFNKVKGAMLNQFDNSVRTNNYWFSAISMYLTNGVDLVTDGLSSIQNLTLEGFNAKIKGLYNGENYIDVVMTGVPKAQE